MITFFTVQVTISESDLIRRMTRTTTRKVSIFWFDFGVFYFVFGECVFVFV